MNHSKNKMKIIRGIFVESHLKILHQSPLISKYWNYGTARLNCAGT